MEILTRTKSRIIWSVITAALWANLVLAQEGEDVAEAGNDFGPMLAILLGGLLVITLLGVVMYSREDSNNN